MRQDFPGLANIFKHRIFLCDHEHAFEAGKTQMAIATLYKHSTNVTSSKSLR